ncbi:hypothetical protein KKB10_03785 [Patescibacteria group bacterium]|nr:hypothetical protein [Patescibacteria group bacterium]MBU1952025.1 hypothetical protein [Patescibacteria group bacterium]MBU2229296.1 hypothetical protein [Patescibacteria group bacterium]
MSNDDEYKMIMSEMIKKQVVILGPDIAIMKAKNVKELVVGADGEVTEINGDAQAVLQKLIDEYVALSGLIVKKTMEPLLAKYPSIKVGQ